MSVLDQNSSSKKVNTNGRIKRPTASNGGNKDFSKVGGLGNNLKVLRETIIFPLLHSNVFTHFNIKAPRGILFYGPPGTGKTLVAGALATEINRQGIGKVTFFQRKGADVLDKWVGGSEKNLRDLFEKATKSRPAIIFFDEIDGLAPAREKQTDQVHASIVATLLALMDGLDNKPGLIVVGATNRLESVDPALRRPGRFDKELYFPLPGFEARKEILQVHTNVWKHKTTPEFLNQLVEATAGFSGADLQALCTEAVLGCMKRVYSNLHVVKIDAGRLKVEPCDFLQARQSLVPSAVRQGQEMRSLSCVIRPLLEKQLTKILRSIQLLWPHFLQEDFKYLTGKERYAGRVILVGTNNQGLSTHIIPAILQNLEHLPSYIFDNCKMLNNTRASSMLNNQASVVLLSRVDEWWNFIDDGEKQNIVNTLEKIHAGLPILSIATCRNDVPHMLQDFFFNNSSIRIKIHNPTTEERKNFFRPLFFDDQTFSLYTVLLRPCDPRKNKTERFVRTRRTKQIKLKSEFSLLCDETNLQEERRISTRNKRKRESANEDSSTKKKLKTVLSRNVHLNRSSSMCNVYDLKRPISIKKEKEDFDYYTSASENSDIKASDETRELFAGILSSLIDQNGMPAETMEFRNNILNKIKQEPSSSRASDDEEADSSSNKMGDRDVHMQQIENLWKHTSLVTSKNMSVAELELLYDVISACININCNSSETLLKNLDDTLRNIESSYQVNS